MNQPPTSFGETERIDVIIEAKSQLIVEQMRDVVSVQVQMLLQKREREILAVVGGAEGHDGAERIRLAGFDDVTVAGAHNLTTVHQPLDAIAEAALQTLVSRIKAPDLPPRTILLEAELVVRG